MVCFGVDLRDWRPRYCGALLEQVFWDSDLIVVEVGSKVGTALFVCWLYVDQDQDMRDTKSIFDPKWYLS